MISHHRSINWNDYKTKPRSGYRDRSTVRRRKYQRNRLKYFIFKMLEVTPEEVQRKRSNPTCPHCGKHLE